MVAPAFTLRPATPVDADGCAVVHHASWVQTYSALLPADHFETDTLAVRTERWLANGAPVTVAEQDGQVIGFAIADRSRRVGEHPPVTERELYSLYVLGAHHGGGAGQALLDAALPPGSPAQLWVATGNPRARRFYERNGFRADVASHVGAQLDLAEVRMVRRPGSI